MKLSKSNVPDDEMEYEKQQMEIELENEKQAELKRIERKKKEKIARDAYQKRLNLERVELMKLKQGVIENSEMVRERHDVISKPKGKKAIENFWYHYRYILLGTLFVIGVASFLIIDYVNTPKSDISVIVLPDEGLSLRLPELEKFLEKYAVDVNGDGKIHVSIMHIPVMNQNDPTISMANQAKLMAEMQSGRTVLIISNAECDAMIDAEGLYTDLTGEYPDNDMITERGLILDNDKIRDAMKWDAIPTDMYIGMRIPSKTIGNSLEKMEKTYDIAKTMFDKLVDDLS